MAKLSKHSFRSNTLPAITMVGPVTLWLGFFVAIPLIYVFIMSFCSIDEGYNVVFKFTLNNYRRLFDPNYVQIYGTSLFIAFFDYDYMHCNRLPFFISYCKNNLKA